MMYLNGSGRSVDLKDLFSMTEKIGHSFVTAIAVVSKLKCPVLLASEMSGFGFTSFIQFIQQ
jgi:hypothetical protein